VSGYALLNPGSRSAALAALGTARAAGHSTSIDPASAGPIAKLGTDEVLVWLADADIVLANEDEACLLAGTDDPLAAGAALADRVGQVVVKLGAGGAAWFAAGADPATVPAEPVVVVDTTGAGDAFAAGFLPAWLAGAAPAEALAAGCRLAARVVAAVGARPHG